MYRVNLTPHALNVYLPNDTERVGRVLRVRDGAQPVLTVPSSGFARVKEIVTPQQPISVEGVAIPVFAKGFAANIDGLPKPAQGTGYVVSFITAQAAGPRTDVYYPGEAVRNEAGDIVGSVGLSRI